MVELMAGDRFAGTGQPARAPLSGSDKRFVDRCPHRPDGELTSRAAHANSQAGDYFFTSGRANRRGFGVLPVLTVTMRLVGAVTGGGALRVSEFLDATGMR
jgi:hypothetical protein